MLLLCVYYVFVLSDARLLCLMSVFVCCVCACFVCACVVSFCVVGCIVCVELCVWFTVMCLLFAFSV